MMLFVRFLSVGVNNEGCASGKHVSGGGTLRLRKIWRRLDKKEESKGVKGEQECQISWISGLGEVAIR